MQALFVFRIAALPLTALCEDRFPCCAGQKFQKTGRLPEQDMGRGF